MKTLPQTQKKVTKKEYLRVAPWEQYAGKDLSDAQGIVAGPRDEKSKLPSELQDTIIETHSKSPKPESITEDEVPQGCVCFRPRRRSSENRKTR